MTKACIFDAFGTLFNLDKSLLSSFDHPKVSAILNYARQKQLSYTWLYSLMNQYLNFEEITTIALRDGCLSCDAPLDLVDQLSEIYVKPTVFSDILPVLNHLKDAQTRTGILSNGTHQMLQSGITKNALTTYINAVYSADDIRLFKPHPAVYQMVCDGEGMSPEDVLFISSNQWDIAGAHAFGFRTVWLNRNDTFRESIIDQKEIIVCTKASDIIEYI